MIKTQWDSSNQIAKMKAEKETVCMKIYRKLNCKNVQHQYHNVTRPHIWNMAVSQMDTELKDGQPVDPRIYKF